jgi:hypothetical protein
MQGQSTTLDWHFSSDWVWSCWAYADSIDGVSISKRRRRHAYLVDVGNCPCWTRMSRSSRLSAEHRVRVHVNVNVNVTLVCLSSAACRHGRATRTPHNPSTHLASASAFYTTGGSPVPFTVLSCPCPTPHPSAQDWDTEFQGTHPHLRPHHDPHHRPHQRVRRQGERGRAIDARQWRAPHWDAQDTAGDQRQAQAPARPASVPNGACQSDPIPTLNLILLLCPKEPSTCLLRVSGACSRHSLPRPSAQVSRQTYHYTT